jgi:hypothetical protein
MRWKKTDKTEWHKVFAWWPVTTVCNTVVWLECVEYMDGKIGPDYDGHGWVQIRPSKYRLIGAGDKE